MNKSHHIRIATDALSLLPADTVVAGVLSRHVRSMTFGAYAPDTVAYWDDHIMTVNPYDPTDPPRGRAVELLMGLADTVATLVLPFSRDLRHAAFLLGCLAHFVADLNQPYHVAARHSVDADEHREFERAMQRWVLGQGRRPEFRRVTVPQDLGAYLRIRTLPRSYDLYRRLSGRKEVWGQWYQEVHDRAVHDVLVVWLYVDGQVARRRRVKAVLDSLPAEEWEPVTDSPEAEGRDGSVRDGSDSAAAFRAGPAGAQGLSGRDPDPAAGSGEGSGLDTQEEAR